MRGPARIQGVVLAGGDSERFGDDDKALADLDGRPLLAHVLDAVTLATDERPMLAVASEGDGERLTRALELGTDDLTVVTDDPSLDGPLAGLLGAARRSESPWLLVCGCDMPLVSAETLGVLIARAHDGVDAVVPVVDGHDQPMLALYDRKRVLDLAPELAGQGPRALLDLLDSVERIDATGVDAPLANAVTNVNTRAELDAVGKRAGDRG
jgi:molybdopterin-guanine dinucleotide biosynthesis protein A